MTSRLRNMVLGATLVMITASSAAAQTGAPAPARPATGRPLWKNVLIGLGAGVGGGLMIGKALSYAQEAKCDGGAPNVSCTTPYSEKTLAPAGAAIGVGAALVWHGIHRSTATPSKTRIVIPAPALPQASTTAPRQALFVNADF